MLELQILGPLQVVSNAGPVAVGSVAQQRLVVRLALAGSAGVGVDLLCDDLDVSGGALRTAVSRLRKTLGGVVVTRHWGYALDGVDLDSERFERAVAAVPEVAAAERVALLDVESWHSKHPISSTPAFSTTTTTFPMIPESTRRMTSSSSLPSRPKISMSTS